MIRSTPILKTIGFNEAIIAHFSKQEHIFFQKGGHDRKNTK